MKSVFGFGFKFFATMLILAVGTVLPARAATVTVDGGATYPCNEAGFDVRQANCDDVVKSGGNNPASVTVAAGGFGGSGRNVGLTNAGLWINPKDVETVISESLDPTIGPVR